MKVVKIREFTYPTYVGGIETCLHTLLPALSRMGLNVTLLTCGQKGLPNREYRDGAEIRRIDLLGVISILTARLKACGMLYGIIARALFLLILPVHIIKAVGETGADIIHVHCLCALSALPASMASLLTGKPLIITMHGTFLGYYEKTVPPPLSWLIPAAEKAYLRLGLYHKILAEDKYTISTLLGLGVPGEKLDLLPYPCVDTCKFRHAMPLKTLSRETIIMHHGRLVRKRGLKTLIQAMPKVLREKPDARLVIAGEGPEKPRLKRLALELGVADHVTFMGLVPYEHVPSLIKSSALIVVPSLIEGHSASVVEAMAAAKPIIATRVGGITEIVEDGETGILVEPDDPDQLADAIIRLLKDPEMAELLGRKASQSVEKYDVENLAAKELKAYENLMRKTHMQPNNKNLKIFILALAMLTQAAYLAPYMGDLASRLLQMHDELLYSWVTLSACLLWFMLKRRHITQDIKGGGKFTAGSAHAFFGFSLLIASSAAEITFPATDFFHAAAAALLFISGVFLIFGNLIPLAISCAYLAGIWLPVFIQASAHKPLSELAAQTMASALRILGYGAAVNGAYVSIPAPGGFINAYIDPVCAGSTSLSVFICLFTLITIDIKPKPNWTTAIFLTVGCLGTLAQAMLRLILIGVIGANYGFEAFLTAHNYLGYMLFPAYFISFTYIYLKLNRKREAAYARG